MLRYQLSTAYTIEQVTVLGSSCLVCLPSVFVFTCKVGPQSTKQQTIDGWAFCFPSALLHGSNRPLPLINLIFWVLNLILFCFNFLSPKLFKENPCVLNLD
ncbi:hypothetical protein EPI10_014667 [Gossypium australe]|uniref:Uncharacterized protein n=1 Tax=Gossypium australe TaxID=47621 RepID=A0A5B6VID4_9ROSI|nr:hypothetical protein EPI10_014667 [Gossypium australe]